MADIIVRKKGLLRSGGGPFWYYSSICLPKNIAAALASMDFIGTKLGIVGSHECHCACYIAVCEDRGDGEGVGGDTLDGSKRFGCGIGIVKGFAVFQKLLQSRGEATLRILFFRHAYTE